MMIRCLIAEDSAFIREIYYFSLRNIPHFQIIGEASDGEAALKMIAIHKPDILLLDLVLPLKNGLDILHELSSLSPETKVIVISSLDDEEIILKAKALGAIEYLKKPFTKIQLITAIEEVCKNYSEVQNG